VRIAFASGKGGTGKTLLSTSLAWRLGQRGDVAVIYADADVEEPNGHLFLAPEPRAEELITVPLPTPVPERCTGAHRCQDACAYNAILAVGTRVMVDPDLCHACGGCVLACEDQALVEVPHRIGALHLGAAGPVLTVGGELDIGQARATPAVDATLAAALREAEARDADVVIVDAPPGTSCATMAAVRGADLVVLVTEPTPFGLHDLRLAVEMCRAMGRPIAVVINRADLGDDAARAYVLAEGLPLLAELPFDRAIATAYADGAIGAARSDAVRDVVDTLWAFAAAAAPAPAAPQERS